LSFALEGNEIVIVDNGKPLARLVPIAQKTKQRVAGLNKGMIWTSDDFDAPLPDEFWIDINQARD
jgi:antitoxin (DNA-binding transcriptional repressor) of toxin-antitoxin stability system